MDVNPHILKASCRCGRVATLAAGKPIMRVRCYCESCRAAGLGFARAPEAISVVGGDGGTVMVLYRKDRVGRFSGRELLQEHRLKPRSPTRRVVAACCHTRMVLDFIHGHWLSVYRGRLSGEVPPLDERTMLSDLPNGSVFPGNAVNSERQPGRFMWRLLSSWAAMGFRRPVVA